jgi:hypothetical protein
VRYEGPTHSIFSCLGVSHRETAVPKLVLGSRDNARNGLIHLQH